MTSVESLIDRLFRDVEEGLDAWAEAIPPTDRSAYFKGTRLVRDNQGYNCAQEYTAMVWTPLARLLDWLMVENEILAWQWTSQAFVALGEHANTLDRWIFDNREAPMHSSDAHREEETRDRERLLSALRDALQLARESIATGRAKVSGENVPSSGSDNSIGQPAVTTAQANASVGDVNIVVNNTIDTQPSSSKTHPNVEGIHENKPQERQTKWSKLRDYLEQEWTNEHDGTLPGTSNERTEAAAAYNQKYAGKRRLDGNVWATATGENVRHQVRQLQGND